MIAHTEVIRVNWSFQFRDETGAMAVASLRCDPAGVVEETEGVVFVYGGSEARFHDWKFRTVKWRTARDRRTMSM